MQNKENQSQKVVSPVLNRAAKWAIFVWVWVWRPRRHTSPQTSLEWPPPHPHPPPPRSTYSHDFLPLTFLCLLQKMFMLVQRFLLLNCDVTLQAFFFWIYNKKKCHIYCKSYPLLNGLRTTAWKLNMGTAFTRKDYQDASWTTRDQREERETESFGRYIWVSAILIIYLVRLAVGCIL